MGPGTERTHEGRVGLGRSMLSFAHWDRQVFNRASSEPLLFVPRFLYAAADQERRARTTGCGAVREGGGVGRSIKRYASCAPAPQRSLLIALRMPVQIGIRL
jgi:hypothetical protein